MKHISSNADLNSQLASAGSKLVVVDFFATWCGPCKTLAPVLEGLEKKHSSTIFAKVDVDQANDCAGEHKVTAMPTIVFFKERSEVGRVVGANVGEIQAMIKKYEGGDAFAGTGQTLGGSDNPSTVTGGSSPGGSWASALGLSGWLSSGGAKAAEPPKTVEGPGGSCQIQVRLLDGSTIRGDFEPSHTVQEVQDFVTANLDARGVNAPGFFLMTNFPKVVYKDDALQQTLQDAKLTPRAQLIVRV
ncbi:thioredoxin-like protein [Dissophora ornata]|nr:thioredoxin-like protein [Dissophora ornata]